MPIEGYNYVCNQCHAFKLKVRYRVSSQVSHTYDVRKENRKFSKKEKKKGRDTHVDVEYVGPDTSCEHINQLIYYPFRFDDATKTNVLILDKNSD